MKKLIILTALLGLTGCGSRDGVTIELRYMNAKEAGIIRGTQEWEKHIPGFRGPGIDQPKTTVLVEVNGLVRVCEVDEHASALLQPGTKVSLINAVRKY